MVRHVALTKLHIRETRRYIEGPNRSYSHVVFFTTELRPESANLYLMYSVNLDDYLTTCIICSFFRKSHMFINHGVGTYKGFRLTTSIIILF